MYVDVPEIRRCCCCVPARYGLLVWIYIKLMLSIIALGTLAYIMIILIFFFMSSNYVPICICSGAILMMVVDIIVNIIAVVGAHSKNFKILQFYYKYCMVSLVIFIIVYAAICTMNMYFTRYYKSYYTYVLSNVLWYSVVGFACIGFQGYMLIILKGVVKKQGSNSKFRFFNQAAHAEAKCYMDIDRAYIWNTPDELEGTDVEGTYNRGTDNNGEYDKGLEVNGVDTVIEQHTENYHRF